MLIFPQSIAFESLFLDFSPELRNLTIKMDKLMYLKYINVIERIFCTNFQKLDFLQLMKLKSINEVLVEFIEEYLTKNERPIPEQKKSKGAA
uniref:Uncharacterized protein n=1 Tax=Tolypothrix bouteillei VB521301 TaxID=1479485 RepID=A0A0C1N7E5_9CYAN